MSTLSLAAANTPSRLGPRIGWALSGLVIAFLALDAAMKLLALPIVTQTMQELGWPASEAAARGLGILLLAITLLYAHPRTAVRGAILLTGYLGGAIATHVRIDSPLFSHQLFGLYLGLIAWGGLALRLPALRALILPRA